MPRHLCAAFVYAYATLVRRGRLEPTTGYRDAIRKLKSVAVEPQRDVYLGVAGPRTAAAVASESASSPRYRTQLCADIEDVMEEEALEGVLFHWPPPYRDSLRSAVIARQFVGAMETCLGAFNKKMALVAPQDEGERNQFFPFLVGDKLSYNVVFWTHNLHRGLGTLAHCTVNVPDITKAALSSEQVALQEVMKKGAPELHKQALVTVSLRALRFRLLVTAGPDKLSSADPDKTEALPYTSVCREIAPNHSQWRWTMSRQDGCVHGTYQNMWMSSLHDASDVYFTNCTTGVALFDMAYDDYQGVCGKKHPLTTMIARGLNISNVVH
ncbi:hypothetical protein V5799_021589 [Amblyomma americanum]|uniref:Uncharacterized protein n=1 Tax=Amblyomma americanum TaxID=6943 RepID=A0AAQ4FMY9_AMBAM